MDTLAQDLWPGSGCTLLTVDGSGWLRPTAAYWRHWLARPELSLVAESCRAETRLHRALLQAPLQPVMAAQFDAIADADVAANYRHFIGLRDSVQALGSLQAWYVALFRAGPVTVPPLFVDIVTQAIVQQLLGQTAESPDTPTSPYRPDALTARTAELFFRPQRITVEQGRVLAADSATLAEQSQTQGLGDIGRLLAQAKIPTTGQDLAVLGPDNASRYWAEATRADRSEEHTLNSSHQ